MKGFTLLETLVTVVIFTFILGSMYGVLNVARTNYGTSSVMLELQAQARQAMHQLAREIRQAYLSSIVDKGVDKNIINFSRPGAGNITYSFSPGSGRLWRNSEDTVIANDITGLTFSALTCVSCCAAADTCPKEYIPLQKITLTAGKTVNSRVLTFSLTEQVQIRNP